MNNISIYVHTPFCKHKCYYCDFASFANNEDLINEYYKSLKKEIILRKDEINSREISTVYFGGGTPSYVDSKYIVDIMDILKSEFNINKDAEITIEANPESITDEKLENYKIAGFNRISMGLQSANNDTLKKIGRIHTYEKFLSSYELCKSAGFDNINVDLMFSLPNETLNDFIDSLEEVIMISPSHISTYSLILEEGTKLYDNYRKNNIIIDDTLDRKMYHYCINKLKEYDYEQYEISNFAKKGYESRHNMSCWDFEDYIGFGSNASGFNNNIRKTNKSNIKDYINDLNNDTLPIMEKTQLNIKDLIGEYIMLGLRKIKGIDIDKINKKFNIDFTDTYKDKIENLKNHNLVTIEDNHFRLTYKGLDFANTVMVEFI
ncbi:radical SAM family heme chaperone HemW [Anaerofustis stercorihominis]|uniref:Heme chaperone HemW n=1 Tax=Anaerofustis stercorihominis DSM 17244 TaxID=445971 RepID=B1CBQ4_9FIRM|nr:radical SAM family heme chaperone HemW [Anaerofustis stercorihominis]EDS71701.1 putative oxygen-independent coproporphyrinogen III oxidase [Anaerofustis stercorihominis DSM 17244]MCQ4796242.1 radical SAM family heme chaperone HemW [Anaerofustis stercorihominis]